MSCPHEVHLAAAWGGKRCNSIRQLWVGVAGHIDSRIWNVCWKEYTWFKTGLKNRLQHITVKLERTQTNTLLKLKDGIIRMERAGVAKLMVVRWSQENYCYNQNFITETFFHFVTVRKYLCKEVMFSQAWVGGGGVGNIKCIMGYIIWQGTPPP